MKSNLLKFIICCVLSGASSLFAGGLKNPDFEDGTSTGWTTVPPGHRVVSDRPKATTDKREARRLRKLRRKSRPPFGKEFNGVENYCHICLGSTDEVSLSTDSTEIIKAGNKYTVSIFSKSISGNRMFTLAVFYLDADGTKHRIGLDRGKIGDKIATERAFSFIAEKGMPFIGKPISLTLSCERKGFIADNASIKVEPITDLEKAVLSLPLVKVLDKEGKPNVTISSYKDFQYTQPIENTGSFENTGLAVSGCEQLTSIGNPDYNFYAFKQGLTLKDGESASMLISIQAINTYAGFALDKEMFVLGLEMHGANPFITPDYMAYIARVSMDAFNKELILISRSGNRIDWFACGRKGSYEIAASSKPHQLNLFTRGEASIFQLRKGASSSEIKAIFASSILAPKSFLGRPGLPFADYWGVDYPSMNEQLSIDLNKPVSKEEIEAMKNHIITYPALGIGKGSSSLGDLPGMYVPLKIFLVTRSKEVLDNLIRISDRTIISRNGVTINGEQYGMLIKRNADGTINTRHKCWAYFPVLNENKGDYLNSFDCIKAKMTSEDEIDSYFFNEKHEFVKKYVTTSSQGGNTRGIIPSLTAYCISLHPEIWDQKVPSDPMNLGATYGERGRRYVKELAMHYADFRDLQLVWYKEDPPYETHGADRTIYMPNSTIPVPRHAINRFSSSMSASGFAGNAAEALGETKAMKMIDRSAERILKSWMNCYQFYAPGHHDKYLNEPEKWYRTFSYTAQDVNPEDRTYDARLPNRPRTPNSEDRGHMNFTLNGMQMLYDSHRYEHVMTKKAMTDLARTFDEIVVPEVGKWSTLPRARKDSAYETHDGYAYQYSAFLMFGDFNANLKEKLIKCLQHQDNKRKASKQAIHLLNLVMMRAEKFKQIPKKLVE